MRGEVQIWKGDELIHHEDNLLVNGAGESIVDMLTVSPSLSGIPTASALLDTSNYTIQAISFGKDASAYQFNAHALPSRRNLWPFSTPSSTDINSVTFSNLTVSSTPDVSPPPPFVGTASAIGHVLRIEDEDTTYNSYLSITLTAGNAYTGPNWSVSGGQDNWFCQSCYVKYPADAESVSDRTPTTSISHPRFHWGHSIYGEGRDTSIAAGAGNLGHSRYGTNVMYNLDVDDTDIVPYTPSSLVLNYQNAARDGTARSEGSGYSINNWQQNGGAYPVGDGWYRVWSAGLAPVSGVSSITTTLYPTSFESSPTGETTGSLYAYGFQLELGRWPTELQYNIDNYKMNNWDLSGSVLNRDHVPGFPVDEGTVRVIPPYGTSSYVPTNYLSSPPNPDSTRVEDGDTALLDVSSDALRRFNMGQNLNVIPYRSDPGGAWGEARSDRIYQRLLPYNVSDGDNQVALLKAYSNTNTPASGMDNFGPQAYYLGCYPEGSSTGGSNFALVSSLDNSAAYLTGFGVPNGTQNHFVSGTYNSIVNEASSMDVSGFVNMIMSGSPGTTTGYAMASPFSGLCVSGGHDIQNSGTVEYSMILGAGDVGYSNLYGGIYNMGLFTIDTKASRLAGNMPPYSFGPLDNPRKYKLFATKHLTKNLGYINDHGTNPGCLNYHDLTIKWRIHFT